MEMLTVHFSIRSSVMRTTHCMSGRALSVGLMALGSSGLRSEVTLTY